MSNNPLIFGFIAVVTATIGAMLFFVKLKIVRQKMRIEGYFVYSRGYALGLPT
jgi:hypothetical protein